MTQFLPGLALGRIFFFFSQIASFFESKFSIVCWWLKGGNLKVFGVLVKGIDGG